MIEAIIIAFMLVGGKVYVDVPYKGYPNIKALFMKQWQCDQVKTKNEQCVRINKEYVGLLDKRRK